MYFQSAELGGVRVWIAFGVGDKQDIAMINIENESTGEVTFFPSRVYAAGVLKKKREVEQIELDVFTPKEMIERFERKEASARFWSALGAGLVAAGAGAQASVWHVDGTVMSGGSYGYLSTNVTQRPTAAEQAAVVSQVMAQSNANLANLQASHSMIIMSLAKSHTLLPGTFYGGVIYIDHEELDEITIKIALGPTVFPFTFSGLREKSAGE